ncbi:hypothetical protein VZ94_01525 [Methylocucumis oryzae]|uniref:Uncharacterized protein n=2 Tax=Methylocucumis oryzae TaxID=1632867 RepID=A0A0F3IME3_9GAMM|nr:hypothetical protein VZ94_01525 [Methylocucumis oryzae]
MVLIKKLALDEIKTLIKQSLGLGWSWVAAAQFLTGRVALNSFNSLPDDYELDGLNKLTIATLISVAHDFCANASSSGSISNGLMVANFSKDSPLTDIEKIQCIFNSKEKLH